MGLETWVWNGSLQPFFMNEGGKLFMKQTVFGHLEDRIIVESHTDDQTP